MIWFLKSKGVKLNIADWFSLYRILALPVLVFLMLSDRQQWFAAMLLISFSTDIIDGFLARKLNLVSERGAQLDSIGDALTFVLGFTGVAYFRWDFIQQFAIPISLVFGLYFIQLLIAYIRYGMPSSLHTYLAKFSALLQGLFLVSIHFFGEQTWLFWMVIILGFLETLEEIVIILISPKWQSDVKGLYWILKKRKE